ncbi:MAG: hypothetical protein EBU33_03865, partial [Sphingobacteriia bacterium]|nr:hypothetical protein [Sphingobacteriia bacterium]
LLNNFYSLLYFKSRCNCPGIFCGLLLHFILTNCLNKTKSDFCLKATVSALRVLATHLQSNPGSNYPYYNYFAKLDEQAVLANFK